MDCTLVMDSCLIMKVHAEVIESTALSITFIVYFVKFLIGENFVTRKVTRSVAQIHLGHRESVSTI